MVNYIVNEPAEDASDKLKFVYPYKVTPLPVSPPQRLPVGCLLCSRACAPAFPLAFACSFRTLLHHKAFPPDFPHSILPSSPRSHRSSLSSPVQSSEVLSSDVGSIHDCLLGHEALLDKLFAIVNAEEVPLIDLYFSINVFESIDPF